MASIQFDGVDKGCSSVADFYAGKSVFITGGTGFLGKVILEKILYSCPQVDKLYVLIRRKENLDVQQRAENLKDIPLFDRLKDENPDQLKKIIPIAGDIVLPNLGIVPEDEKIFIKEVSVVIHSAATAKFNERLKTAISVNYEGTRTVLDLCRRMKNIKVLVHVSTAFSNTLNEVIEEEVYPTPMDINMLYDELKERPESDGSKLLCGWPNTYTLTKALAERLVQESRGDVPTVIIRPSIVTPSKSEPIEGWVDSWFGATALLTVIGKGFCRAILSWKQNILDVVPVDYVSNLVVVAAAKCHASKEIEVFNSCSSSTNPITIGQISDMFTEQTVKNGCNDVPFPKVLMTQCRWLYWMVILFIEIIPAYIADFCLIQFANPPKFIKMQSQVSAARNAMEYFTNKSWSIQNDKAHALAASLSPHDAVMFPCDPSDISWPEYMVTYFGGVQRFLFDKKRNGSLF